MMDRFKLMSTPSTSQNRNWSIVLGKRANASSKDIHNWCNLINCLIVMLIKATSSSMIGKRLANNASKE